MKKAAVCAWFSPDGDICSGCLDTTVVAEFEAVYLLTWLSATDLPSLPAHLTVVDVSTMWPEQSLTRMALSRTKDFLRALEVACCFHYAAQNIKREDFSHVCIFECDSIWIGKWDSLGFLGAEFGSVVCRPRLRLKTSIIERKIEGVNDYCQQPFDMRQLSLPFQLSTGSAILQSIATDLSRMVAELTFDITFTFREVMALVLSHVNTHGLRKAILTESTFMPLHTTARASMEQEFIDSNQK